jgi:hypothetical protein
MNAALKLMLAAVLASTCVMCSLAGVEKASEQSSSTGGGSTASVSSAGGSVSSSQSAVGAGGSVSSASAGGAGGTDSSAAAGGMFGTGGVGGAGGSPLMPPMANMGLWLRADAIVGKNDKDPITSWSDSGPNSVHGIVEKGAPAFSAVYHNGQPAVCLVGTDRVRGINTSFDPEHTIHGVWAVPAVMDPAWVFGLGYSGSEFSGLGHRIAGHIGFEVWNISAGTRAHTSVKASTTPYLVTAIVKGASGKQTQEMYINGTSDLQIVSTSASALVRTDWWMGDLTNGGSGAGVCVLEIIVYNGAQSTSERVAVESYLMGKFGLP